MNNNKILVMILSLLSIIVLAGFASEYKLKSTIVIVHPSEQIIASVKDHKALGKVYDQLEETVNREPDYDCIGLALSEKGQKGWVICDNGRTEGNPPKSYDELLEEVKRNDKLESDEVQYTGYVTIMQGYTSPYYTGSVYTAVASTGCGYGYSYIINDYGSYNDSFDSIRGYNGCGNIRSYTLSHLSGASIYCYPDCPALATQQFDNVINSSVINK